MSIVSTLGSATDLWADQLAAIRPLPPVIDGTGAGNGWQPATDPHALPISPSPGGQLPDPPHRMPDEPQGTPPAPRPADGPRETTTLAQVEGVVVTREKGGGAPDTVVFTTTDAQDDVSVAQRADGTQDVIVNGQTTNVRLAPGQALQVRTQGGDDKVDVSGQVDRDVTVYGGEGQDVLTTRNFGLAPGTAFPDRSIALNGEGGDDTIQGEQPAYRSASAPQPQLIASGGDGDDTLSFKGGASVSGGAGDDRIDADGEGIVTGDAGNDTMSVKGNAPLVSGGDGDDHITVVGTARYVPDSERGRGLPSAASVSGGRGDDTIDSSGTVTISTDGGKDQVNVHSGHAEATGQFTLLDYLFKQAEFDRTTVDPGATLDTYPG